MAWRWQGALVSVIAAVVSAQDRSVEDPAGFAAALAEVSAAVDAGNFGRGADRFAALLEVYGGSDAARAAREALIEEARRIAFRRAYARPALRDLVAGELREWNPATRQLELDYRADRLDDFRPQEGGGHLHPLTFSGAYQVVVRGACYPAAPGPRLFVGVVAGRAYEVAIGGPVDAGAAHVPPRVALLTASGAEILATAPRSPAVPGEPFVIRVGFGPQGIRVAFDGEELWAIELPGAEPGQVGFWEPSFDSITIAGEAPAAWLESRLAAHREQARAAFVRRYDPTADLPAALFEDPPSAVPEVLPAHPGKLEPRQQVLRALGYLRGGELAAAAACIDEVLAAAPEFDRGRILRATIRIRLGDHATGVAELEALLESHPRCLELVELLAGIHLRAGDRRQAAALLAAARRRGLESDVLQELRWTLVKAARGPDWEQRHEHRTRHYHVVSDIDRRTCIDVGTALEEAYAVFEAELGRPIAERGPLQVLVFGGGESYRSYHQGVLGDVRIHTSGLYCAPLRQMLVWHVGDHRRTLRTVRHEGLHQYLAAAMPEPPLWFNEGLAEFYTVDRQGTGRYTGGALRAVHLRTLGTRPPLPLASFLMLPAADFHADAELAYAQSWAFVHFLRQRSRRHQQRFRELFAAFTAGRGGGEAVAAVFGEDLPRIEAEFRAYLRELVPDR